MDMYFVAVMAGVLMVFAGGGMGAGGKPSAGVWVMVIGAALAVGGVITTPLSPQARADAARATIAAATAAVAGGTAESELRALELAASVAATAAASEGVGR